jgi:Ca-activated chloride channel family protein
MKAAIAIAWLGVAGGLFSCSGVLAAQERRNSPDFRANADMVLVPVTVVNRRGEIMSGLQPDSFTLLEDQVTQPIVSFTGEDVPCSVGLILDLSGSMREALGPAKGAARAFLETSNPDDDFFLLTVSDSPRMASGFTSDIGSLESRIRVSEAAGNTALIDTIYMGLDHMRASRKARRALLVVSDGMDNHSRYTQAELMRLALEADVQIYTIAIDRIPRYKKPIQVLEERRGLAMLQDLSERTGGLHFTVMNLAEINDAAVKLSRAIRNQYVIGYQPQSNQRYGKWRRIHVKVNLPNASVYARNGYYSH